MPRCLLGILFWALVSCIVIGICFEVFCLFFLATGSPLFVLGALASVIILLRERRNYLKRHSRGPR